MVKSQAKTTVFSLTASRPNTQVRPSRGRRMTVAFRILLKNSQFALAYRVFAGPFGSFKEPTVRVYSGPGVQ